LPGHRYADVSRFARRLFRKIASKTRRRPYIRSAYFDNEKIFLDNFWPHLLQKHHPDRFHRLRYFECAIELIQKSKIKPIYIKKIKTQKEILYRFIGKTGEQYFAVQIKEDLTRNQKFFMSVFEFNEK
jgi:hypothetical protein